jgi:hypothetical protein
MGASSLARSQNIARHISGLDFGFRRECRCYSERGIHRSEAAFSIAVSAFSGMRSVVHRYN